ncbi:16S rRNA (cytosine(967)-C(5))-methyltransferase RsmB [Bacillus timonensis]|nr:16S rRNA (cytosine(967)-C(5))-methyltransferase RsmB [Bacillus timonensis]
MSNVRETALDILLAIEKNQAYSNLLLNKMIQKNKVNGKDVGLLTEIVYGTIQRRETLNYFLTPFLNAKKKTDQWVLILLRLSLYQMTYLDRVPDRAIIHEAVEIAKKRGHKGISSLVNGVLRNIQRQGLPSLNELTDPNERLAIETSHPLWMVNRWVDQIGYEETKKMCETNNVPPMQTARVNLNKISVDELLHNLKEEGIQAKNGELAPNSIVIEKGNVAFTNSFRTGLLTIQDESSMLVAHALGVNEGDRVLDSCAAPGGKTTHIAELLRNSGQVVSLDLHEHKIKLINDQLERLELSNVETMALDSRKVVDFFEKESFDKILVDAPCSGLGVIRRKPDVKYSKTEEDITRLATIQLSILNAVVPLLKKGGTLVYSTCTIDQQENTDVTKSFLQQNRDFSYDNTLASRMPQPISEIVKNGQIQLFPHLFNTDGFYIASFRKQV